MGTVWNHSGHYETFFRDIIKLCGKLFPLSNSLSDRRVHIAFMHVGPLSMSYHEHLHDRDNVVEAMERLTISLEVNESQLTRGGSIRQIKKDVVACQTFGCSRKFTSQLRPHSCKHCWYASWSFTCLFAMVCVLVHKAQIPNKPRDQDDATD